MNTRIKTEVDIYDQYLWDTGNGITIVSLDDIKGELAKSNRIDDDAMETKDPNLIAQTYKLAFAPLNHLEQRTLFMLHHSDDKPLSPHIPRNVVHVPDSSGKMKLKLFRLSQLASNTSKTQAVFEILASLGAISLHDREAFELISLLTDLGIDYAVESMTMDDLY
jgi:hypothetical protein